MTTERNIKIEPIRVPEWIDGKFEDQGCQNVCLYMLTADEADELLKRFCEEFRRKFVLGEKR